jgi:hypothetical protein
MDGKEGKKEGRRGRNDHRWREDIGRVLNIRADFDSVAHDGHLSQSLMSLLNGSDANNEKSSFSHRQEHRAAARKETSLTRFARRSASLERVADSGMGGSTAFYAYFSARRRRERVYPSNRHSVL